MSKKHKYRPPTNQDGPPCPRCGGPTEVRRHETLDAKTLKRPFYYTEWYYCHAPRSECVTTLIMPNEKRVYRSEGTRAYFERNRSQPGALIVDGEEVSF